MDMPNEPQQSQSRLGLVSLVAVGFLLLVGGAVLSQLTPALLPPQASAEARERRAAQLAAGIRRQQREQPAQVLEVVATLEDPLPLRRGPPVGLRRHLSSMSSPGDNRTPPTA